ncbi:hypothetical protein NQ314_014354 [Rhamnusium bicolor]|uniref:Uncharacterized protein n=1 Tax=Rhamnusium bicolor TaxID=1586634 RepID=A0AAV8X1S7_9CUCU|nr:hypothetical protein NQ314_014354 [Rhamnusium bicolor]
MTDFFINHDLVRVIKIKHIFDEIKKFLQLAPKEIIVLDFHRFPYPTNFTYNLHKKFIDVVYEALGIHALPTKDLQVGKGPSLNEIWAKNKNLIICYADKATVIGKYNTILICYNIFSTLFVLMY